VSVCLRLSQVGVLSKRMNESRWVFFARVLPSTYTTLCYKEIQVPSKIRLLPSRSLLQTLDSENFATVYRSSKRAINLARERWTPKSVINWTVVGQLSRQYLRAPTLDRCSLSQRSSSSVYSTVLSRGSFLATAGTCSFFLLISGPRCMHGQVKRYWPRSNVQGRIQTAVGVHSCWSLVNEFSRLTDWLTARMDQV